MYSATAGGRGARFRITMTTKREAENNKIVADSDILKVVKGRDSWDETRETDEINTIHFINSRRLTIYYMWIKFYFSFERLVRMKVTKLSKHFLIPYFFLQYLISFPGIGVFLR